MQNNHQGKEYEKNKNEKMNYKKKHVLDIVEGFSMSSIDDQNKNPSEYNIPNGLDPGQMVMCENDQVRYVRLTQQNNFLTVQEVEVYDKNNVNVALTNNTSAYSNNYDLTDGLCRTDYGSTGYPGSEYYGKSSSLQECENACNSKLGCTAYEMQNEVSAKEQNCYLYKDPSVKGNNSKNEICRVRIRKEGTPIATMSSQYKNTNPYMAINGKKNQKESWPNSACTASKQGGWWEVDLGKEVDVKKVVIYNRPDGNIGNRLNGTVLTLIDKNHNQVFSSKLNGNRKQVININLTKKTCGGPVLEKNIDDFEDLKKLQLEYFKELQIYNQTMKNLMDNYQHYSGAISNKNSFRNNYIEDSETGKIGYVTKRGVWKHIPNTKAKDLMNGKNSCPTSRTKKVNKLNTHSYSIGNAPVGTILDYGDNKQLIKGTPTIYGNRIPGSSITVGQTCNYAGENIYVTQPNRTKDLKYTGCFKQAGTYQSDLGTTNPANLNFDACKQRAEDLGSNDFALGRDGRCYVGTNNNLLNDNNYCAKEDNIWVGNEIQNYRCYDNKDSPGNDIRCKFGDANFDQAKKDCDNNPDCGAYNFWSSEGSNNSCIKTKRAYSVGNMDGNAQWSEANGFKYCVKNYYSSEPTYAGYKTSNADNSALAKTYYITDNIQSKLYPDSIATKTGNDFEEVSGFDSWGNDILSGTLKDNETIEDIKKLCINTQGCAGFVMRNRNYWLKNGNMWPKGARQLKKDNSILYVRKTNVNSNNLSCSKKINFSSQQLFNGIEQTGTLMSETTKCAIGKISQLDREAIDTQYKNLNKILDKIYIKIQELTKKDIALNKRLVEEYHLLKKRLNNYEKIFAQIENEKKLISKDSAMNENATLNMLSYNKYFIIWSIIAMGLAYGTIKVMKP